MVAHNQGAYMFTKILDWVAFVGILAIFTIGAAIGMFLLACYTIQMYLILFN